MVTKTWGNNIDLGKIETKGNIDVLPILLQFEITARVTKTLGNIDQGEHRHAPKFITV